MRFPERPVVLSYFQPWVERCARRHRLTRRCSRTGAAASLPRAPAAERQYHYVATSLEGDEYPSSIGPCESRLPVADGGGIRFALQMFLVEKCLVLLHEEVKHAQSFVSGILYALFDCNG